MASRIDWAFGRGHGPVAGAVNAALAAGAAAGVMYLRHWDPRWAILAGVLAAIASVVAAKVSTNVLQNKTAMVYRALVCLAASVWVFGVLQHRPWTYAYELRWAKLLGIGGGAAVVVGWVCAWFNRRAVEKATPDQPQEPPDVKPPRPSKLSVRGAELKHTINTVCHIASYNKETGLGGIEVVNIEDWRGRDGYTAELQLPADGTTIHAVKESESKLAHAMDLPPGCKVEVLTSETGRRTILMRVRTHNRLSDPLPMPADVSFRSINDPIGMGMQSDGSLASINLRFFSGAMIGAPHSGKSNQLNVILHGLMRCRDVFICGIDVTGSGRLFANMIYPYLEGVTSKPAIDFVAVDEAQAEQMCLGIIAAVNERTVAYKSLMRKEHVDYLPVSKTLPQIVLVVDEWGELSETVRDLIVRIAEMGRGGAARVFVCGLRAIGNKGIPRTLLAKCQELAAMRVTAEGEAQAIFDTTWRSGRFDPQDLPASGFGFWSTNGHPAKLFKGFRLDPDGLIDAAIKTAARRPPLDAKSAEVWNRVGGLADRWHYTLERMFGDEYQGPRAQTLELPEQRTPEAAVELSSGVATAVERSQAAVEAAKRAQTQAWANRVKPAAPRVRYETLMREGEPVTATELYQKMRAEGYETQRQTIIDWLKGDVADKRVKKLPQEGRGVPYVWIRD